MKIDRLLGITMLFLSRKSVTARELANEFGVTLRTIFRDIETLRNAGIPIDASVGNGGGYGIAQSYRIDRQILSPGDLLNLLTALKATEATLPARKSAELYDKMSALVAPDDRHHIDNMINRHDFDIFNWGTPQTLRENVANIKEALEKNRCISFDYAGVTRNIISSRTVEPHKLLARGTAWYLYGYCLTRKDFRLFKLSRIRTIRHLGKSFTPRPIPLTPFEIDTVDKRIPTTITMAFAPGKQFFLDEYFSDSPQTHLSNGWISITIAMPFDDWLVGMVLSHRDNVIIIDPPEVRSAIIAAAKAIVKQYQS